MELTQLGKALFPKGYLELNTSLGEWEVSINQPNSGYRLVLATRALEIKALVDMGIIELKK